MRIILLAVAILSFAQIATAQQLTDQQIRQVDVGKTNIAVAVVHRGSLNNPQARVAEHDLVSEVYNYLVGSVNA
jgi:hypothetical protein